MGHMAGFDLWGELRGDVTINKKARTWRAFGIEMNVLKLVCEWVSI